VQKGREAKDKQEEGNRKAKQSKAKQSNQAKRKQELEVLKPIFNIKKETHKTQVFEIFSKTLQKNTNHEDQTLWCVTSSSCSFQAQLPNVAQPLPNCAQLPACPPLLCFVLLCFHTMCILSSPLSSSSLFSLLPLTLSALSSSLGGQLWLSCSCSLAQ
jgi:hypothetical protein